MKTAIIVSCFDWYEKRLIYIDTYLRKRGYNVKVMLSDFNHIEKRYCTRKSHIDYIHTPKYKRNISLRRLYSHFCFSEKVYKKITIEAPDLIYCLVPPNMLVKKMAKLSSKSRLIFDVIDLWPESFPHASDRDLIPFRMWKKIRNDYINKADIVVMECNYYKNIVGLYVDNNKLNTLMLVKRPLPEHHFGNEPESKICLGYLGSINSLIDTDRIIAMVEQMRKKHEILIKIIGDGENRDLLIEKIKKKGVEVQFYGKIYDDMEKERILSECHFGINIYKPGIRIGLTMKSIDYFQIGLPVLNTIQGDTYGLVNKYDVGINMDKFTEKELVRYVSQIAEVKSRVLRVFDIHFNADNIETRLSFLDSVL